MTKTLTERCRDGDRFGKLTVLGFHHKDKHYHSYYECVCDCGKKTMNQQLVGEGKRFWH